MHIYTIEPFATKDGKAHACDIFHSFAGKRRHIATTRRYAVYPAGVRANDEARAIAERHARQFDIPAESMQIKFK